MRVAPVVHIIDDDAAARESLSCLLETAGYDIAVYASVDTFLDPSSIAQGCVISDARLPDMAGLYLLSSLKEKGLRLPVIIMSGTGSIPMAVEAIRHGALDFIEKPFSKDVILQAVMSALDGAPGFKSAPAVVAQRKVALLSIREPEVLGGLLAGQSNKIIGHNLGISPRTVEIHRANLMLKMEADSLSMLLRTALLAQSEWPEADD